MHKNLNSDFLRDRQDQSPNEFRYYVKFGGKYKEFITKGVLAFSPPLLSETEYKHLKDKIQNNSTCKINDSVVLTAVQYRELMRLGFDSCHLTLEKEYIWLNSPYQKMPFQFNAVPWIRGLITGTSLIPPSKVKELLTDDSQSFLIHTTSKGFLGGG